MLNDEYPSPGHQQFDFTISKINPQIIPSHGTDING